MSMIGNGYIFSTKIGIDSMYESIFFNSSGLFFGGFNSDDLGDIINIDLTSIGKEKNVVYVDHFLTIPKEDPTIYMITQKGSLI